MIAEAFSVVVEKEEPSPLTLPVHESTEDEVDLIGIVTDESVHPNDELTKIPGQTAENESDEIEAESFEITEVVPQEIIEPAQQVPEKSTEKIVPFNVLMLKSDKEKIAASKLLKPKETVEISASKQSELTASRQTSAVPEKAHLDIEGADEVAVTETVEEMDEQPYYAFPSLDYLIPPESQIEDTEWLASQSEKLEEALSHFAVKADVIEAVQGPTVTRFELTVGVKGQK